MKVAIIGSDGWVGRAMQTLFPKAVKYDALRQNPTDDTMQDVNDCEIAFICVPTPNLPNGALDTSIVEQMVAQCQCPLIIIRSTVMPGTCDKLERTGKNIVFQPEYLGETVAHPLFDQHTRPFLILGGRPESRRKAIELYQTVFNAEVKIRQVTNYEAEVIKLSENRAIMFKVLQCQELYDACEKAGVDYYTVREAVYADDPRFNLWWTFVYPDNRGARSKCIPKDVLGWAAWAESVGHKPTLTRSLLKSNDEIIRNNSK